MCRTIGLFHFGDLPLTKVRRTDTMVRRTRGLFQFGDLLLTKVRRTDTMVHRTSGLTAKNLHFSPQNGHKSIPNPHHDPQTLNHHQTNLNDDIVSLINTGIKRIRIRATESPEIGIIRFQMTLSTHEP